MKTAYFIALAAILATGAQAQSHYACTVDGRTVISTQPCVRSGIVYYGPAPTKPTYEAPIPPSRPAPNHLQYLNARCASLNDAVRTAATRGLKYDAINQLQRDYSEQCAENEREAYSQISQERKDSKKKLAETIEVEKMEQERSLVRQQQCGESKRILYNKRARKDLTDGEKADLQRFEDNYYKRCS